MNERSRESAPGDAPRTTWILAENKTLRLLSLFVLYVCQGLPIGLFWFAIPAWMAANGAGAADVGQVVGLTALPWTLKLVNGFLMDRYAFLPMGRRRAWLAGAQMVMVVCLLVAAAFDPAPGATLFLGLIGFVVNMATTFQDVAVDGLAVDVLEDDERARGSGMMFGGQAIGISAGTAVNGFVIARFGAASAYLMTSALIASVTVVVLCVRERKNERLLPWSPGEAHPRNRAVHVGAWAPIFGSTFRSLIRPVSLLWVVVLLVKGFHYGVFTGITPLIGTGEVGWTEQGVTNLVGSASLLGGILGLTVGGWLGDRFGAKWAGVGLIGAYLLLSSAMWMSVTAWSDPNVFRAFGFGWLGLDTLFTVAVLPISMRLCDPRVAATQFTLYMASTNFGISTGAWALGFSGQLGGLPNMFKLVFALHLVGLLVLLTVRFPRRSDSMAEVAAELAEGEGPVPARN